MRACVVTAIMVAAAVRLEAADPGPTQSVSPDGNAYHAPIGVNDPFPDSNYGADHGGSSLSLTYPYLSPFGNTDRSRGQFVYSVAPFQPRGSEGVFGMDVWLEQQDGGGNWSPAALNGGVCDAGMIYQPVNTPNPGPSPSYTFTWTYDSTPLPANASFRVFVYVYLYNQGGGSQGDYAVESATNSVSTAFGADPPRIAWTPAFGAVNPSQVTAGQTYIISADAQDDNDALAAVSIDKNGQPFAYAGGGDGYSGNSQNPSSDPPGAVTYTAWATDDTGAQSPTISWTVNVVGKSNQAPVASLNATAAYYSGPFTPSFAGGSGSGGWQFCVAGYTNWDGGASGYAGTNLGTSPGNSPGADWAPAWTPPAPGQYSFWIARDGDATFNPSALAGPYTLTVTPAAPVGSFDAATPGSLLAGSSLSGNGWAADAQTGAPLSSVQILIDGGSAGSFPASLGQSRPDVQAANATWANWSPLDLSNSGWSFQGTAPATLTLGSHTLTAVAYDATYGVSAVIGAQNIQIAAPPPAASPAPAPDPSPDPTPAPSPSPIPSPSPTPAPAPSPAPSPPPSPGSGAQPEVARVRYLGEESFLWQDPSGLTSSPWPSFASPQPLTPSSVNTTVPTPP